MPSRPKCLHCWDNAYSLQLKVVISCVSRNYLLLCCLHLSTWVWCGYDEKTHDLVHIDMYLVPMFCVWCALLRLCYGHDRIINGRPTISCSGNSILYNQYFCHSLFVQCWDWQHPTFNSLCNCVTLDITLSQPSITLSSWFVLCQQGDDKWWRWTKRSRLPWSLLQFDSWPPA